METLDEVHQTTHDEYGSKAAGLLSAMEKFSTLFGLKLGYLLFGASETLSVWSCLPKQPWISAEFITTCHPELGSSRSIYTWSPIL